jgi:nucleoside-diphosphate-sugar epimerase
MKSFLILGHKGYLGANLCNMLISRGYEVSVLPGKVTLESIPILAKKYFSKEQIILNCMGSGVSNNSDAKDLSINGTLIEPLLSSFSESTASKFVNFGTKYELPYIHAPQKRLPYVNSKILGSEICHRYIYKDKRIYLLYLPTIIDHNQPVGRFFADFIRSSFLNSKFIITDPFSKICFTNFNTFFNDMIQMINLDDKNVNSISDEGFLDVIDFAHYLNKVLENNGYRPVDIYLDRHVKCTLKENKIKLSNEFCLQTETSVNLISKGFA